MAKNSEQHIALYRKYRPQNFKEVLGQESVLSVLEESAKTGKIAHAYLFAGGRGTGKTSLARIFARAIGCSDKDLYEIDAASNRGIDDIRSLREGVSSLPFESPYKVYIIDEAHMLTKEAWNAFLKTLEEPPPHAIFILATTELEKVPETIISRCEVHAFKKPTRGVLNEMAVRVAKAEGFELEPSAADLIATLADGSYRDAHGILQKAISGIKGKKISAEQVADVAGAPKTELINTFLTALSEKDLEKALTVVQNVEKNNFDISVFLKLSLERMRVVLLLSMSKAVGEDLLTRYSADDAKVLTELSENGVLSLDLLRELLSALAEMPRAYIPALSLELALARVLKV